MKKVFASILGVCALFGASVLLQPAESAKDKSVKRIVYGIPQSPYVRKLMVVMHEKDLDFKLESTLPVSALKQKKQPIPIALSEASPLGKIPAYREDGGFTLADSSVIIDHLEHSGQGPSLYPEDNQQYAKARWFQQYADTVLGAIVDENILRERVLKPRVFGQQPNEEKVKNGIE
ncbi:MAG: glutathione S-transferase family protein, partial [Alphaproteobacteria bacterium]